MKFSRSSRGWVVESSSLKDTRWFIAGGVLGGILWALLRMGTLEDKHAPSINQRNQEDRQDHSIGVLPRVAAWVEWSFACGPRPSHFR